MKSYLGLGMSRIVKLEELENKEYIKISKGKQLPKEYRDNGNIEVIGAGRKSPYYSSHTNHTENTITISSSGAYAGYVWMHNYPIWASDCTVIRVSQDIDLDYMYYFLKSKQELIYSFQSGAGQPHVYWKNVKNIEINLPTLTKQKEIASILDKAQELISLRKESIKKLDELSKSIFIDMFGDPIQNPKNWELNNLSEFGNCKNGLNYNSKINEYRIKCLGVGDFKDLTTIRNIESLPTISIDKKLTKEFLLQNGDIVFVRSNGSKNLVGRCIEIYPNEEGITFSGFCIRFRLSNNLILIPYLLHLLKSKSIRQNMVGRGANIQNLNQQILLGLKIPLPPIALQNKFAKIIEKIEEQKSLYEEELEKLEENFKALLQKSFN
jgi:type I restriction enzyme S subunit